MFRVYGPHTMTGCLVIVPRKLISILKFGAVKKFIQFNHLIHYQITYKNKTWVHEYYADQKKGTLILFLQQKSNKDKFFYLPKTSFHILKTFNDNLITYAIKYIFFFFQYM